MSNYTISKSLNPKRVFILQKSELEKRWDPNTYHQERRDIIQALKNSGHKLEQLKFVSTFKKSIVKEIPENQSYLGLENIESNTGSYITTSDKESISSAIEFKKGQVLFPKLRPYLNKVYFAEFDGVCSTEFHVLDSKKVSNEYLANFLRTSLVVNQTKYLMSGNTLPRLQTEDIESLLIPILSKEEENKVNALMAKAFEQKQKNEAEAEKILSGIDDYLLKELGIKLPEPPENTLKNRMFISTIKAISGNRIDPAYHQVYFHKLVASIVNSKYKSRRIGEEINEINYGASFTNDYVESGVPLLRIKDLRRNEIVIDKVVFLPEIARKLLGNSFVKQNDFLISRSGTIGVVSLVSKEIDGFAFGSFMIKFNLKSDKVLNREFLSYYLNCKLLIDLIERDKIGAIQGNITIPIIKSLLVPVPPLDKQKEIADHITGIRKQAQQLNDKTKELLKKASEEIEELLLN